MLLPIAKFRFLTRPLQRPLIGLDIGSKKTGIAHTDRAQSIAWPLGTIECDMTDIEPFVKNLKMAIHRQKLTEISGWVVGMPLSPLGKKSSHGVCIQSVVNQLIAKEPKLFSHGCFVDERYSTVAARKMAGITSKSIRTVDAGAPYEILCRYLDTNIY